MNDNLHNVGAACSKIDDAAKWENVKLEIYNTASKYANEKAMKKKEDIE